MSSLSTCSSRHFQAGLDRTTKLLRGDNAPYTFRRSFGAMTVAIALLAASPGLAQTVAPVNLPFNAGAAQNQADQARREAPQRAVGKPVLPGLVEPQLVLKDKTTLFIRSFELDGPHVVDEAMVRAILAPYENRKLNLAQIYEAADKITAFYRTQGYLLAKAYVPAQDARKGVLRLKLLPGKYGTITVKNESLVKEDFLHHVIDHALAGSPLIQKNALERTQLLIGDMPGAAIPGITVSAGHAPETTDLLFTVPASQRVNGFLLGDNYGTGYTGRDRLSGGLSLNSPLGYGDKLYGFGLVSDRTHLVNGRAAYTFPIGYDGVTGDIAAFRTTYALGGVYSDLKATGVAEGITGTLNYALRRTIEDSIYLTGNFTHKVVDDKALGATLADRTVDLGTTTIRRDTVGQLPYFALPMTTSTSLSFTAGYVNYADPAQKAANQAGANSAGNYERINLSFKADIALSQLWSFSTLITAQKALSRNLDTSEQFYLTGSYAVRSYDEGLAGDSGYLITPALKYTLPPIYDYHHSLGLFTDVGAAYLEHGSYTVLQRSFTPVYDVGLGYYGNYDYSPGRSLILKAEVAHTIFSDDSLPATKSYDRHTKGLVQIGLTF